MRPVDLIVTLTVAALMFVAGRKSVKRQFNQIKNSSGHTLVVHLDDDRCLHIEDPDRASATTTTKEPK